MKSTIFMHITALLALSSSALAYGNEISIKNEEAAMNALLAKSDASGAADDAPTEPSRLEVANPQPPTVTSKTYGYYQPKTSSSVATTATLAATSSQSSAPVYKKYDPSGSKDSASSSVVSSSSVVAVPSSSASVSTTTSSTTSSSIPSPSSSGSTPPPPPTYSDAPSQLKASDSDIIYLSPSNQPYSPHAAPSSSAASAMSSKPGRRSASRQSSQNPIQNGGAGNGGFGPGSSDDGSYNDDGKDVKSGYGNGSGSGESGKQAGGPGSSDDGYDSSSSSSSTSSSVQHPSEDPNSSSKADGPSPYESKQDASALKIKNETEIAAANAADGSLSTGHDISIKPVSASKSSNAEALSGDNAASTMGSKVSILTTCLSAALAILCLI